MLGEALKDNQYLKLGVVTGVLQIGQQSIFSELNNFEPYSVIGIRWIYINSLNKILQS